MKEDSSGQRYVEFATGINGDRLRITLVTKSDYTGAPRFRLQIHDAGGLRHGPEIPLIGAGEMVGGMVALALSERRNR